MQAAAVCALLALLAADTSAQINGCDSLTIDAINHYWMKHGVPQNIVKTFQSEGIGAMRYSSSNILYMYEIDPSVNDTVRCVSLEYVDGEENQVVSVLTAHNKTVTFYNSEHDSHGILSGSSGISWYVLFAKNGVYPYVACKPHGGSHIYQRQGGVFVIKSRMSSSKKTIHEAYALLLLFGVYLDPYSDDCFTSC